MGWSGTGPGYWLWERSAHGTPGEEIFQQPGDRHRLLGEELGLLEPSLCQNAEIEGLGDPTEFRKASVSALPFGDAAFDLVVSNLTFHEVSDMKDKRELIKEALHFIK